MTRVRLTEDEAKRGVSPEPFSREEWRAMADASREYAEELHSQAERRRQSKRFDSILAHVFSGSVVS